MRRDPDCLQNAASRPDTAVTRADLKAALTAELKGQGDPRMFGQGDVFDKYRYASPAHAGFYERFMRGEKLQTDWVNASDFEPPPLP